MLENQGLNNQINFSVNNNLVYKPQYRSETPMDISGFKVRTTRTERTHTNVGKCIEGMAMAVHEVKDHSGRQNNILKNGERLSFNLVVPQNRHYIKSQIL
jgi:hypothetical protein